MKTWTYEEVTEKTEEEISIAMESARMHAENLDRALHYEYMAMGAFHLWKRLTEGWRSNNSDEERLRELAGLSVKKI